MRALSRRSFLAASAALTAGPALGDLPASGAVDVLIVGAGAAGIAAARRVDASRRSYAVIEATDRVGGRCLTDTSTFGVPYDRGAHWIHMPDINPVGKLAPQSGLDIYPAPAGQRLRIGMRYAREGEMEDFLAAMVRCTRAISDAAHGKTDVSCEQALPKDLGDWRPCVEFVLGPFGCAKPLAEISALDFSKSAERDVDAFCRQGFGALIAKLSEDLRIELSLPAKRIISLPRSVDIETEKGRLSASAVIVTASTGVLASGKIKFSPDLPRHFGDAVAKLTLGSYDHVALEMPGNPLGLQGDDLLFEKATSRRTAALLANISGTTLCYVELAGPFGAELTKEGKPAMIAFARDWLAGLFGADMKKALGRADATQWNQEPWALGAFSAASPGGQGARKTLTEPVHERIFFAGEALHETLWGTVGGAWESGERAADAALKRVADDERPRGKR